MKKRLLSAALVLCLLLALLPMAAFADDDVQTGTCGDGLTWTLDAAGTLTVTGSGVISANAFAFNSKIVRAEIGAGVTGIGLGAFFKCANLEAVTLPAGLTTLGTAAFAYCEKLASVTLPGSLKSTGGGAFQGCTALTAVTILPGVTRIDTRAFSDCAALKEITIPATVTAIGGSAFSGCLALRTVHVGGMAGRRSRRAQHAPAPCESGLQCRDRAPLRRLDRHDRGHLHGARRAHPYLHGPRLRRDRDRVHPRPRPRLGRERDRGRAQRRAGRPCAHGLQALRRGDPALYRPRDPGVPAV